jgi:hypothetical protein
MHEVLESFLETLSNYHKFHFFGANPCIYPAPSGSERFLAAKSGEHVWVRWSGLENVWPPNSLGTSQPPG